MADFYIPKHVTTTFFLESAVILDSQKNMYYSLNDSASEFWKFLTEMNSFETALKQVSELYQDSSDVIRKDMEELVGSLLQVGLLEQVKKA